MRLATIRTGGGTQAVRVEDEAAVELGAPDLADVLRRPDWRASCATATGPSHPVVGLDWAPLVGRPEKVLCVGLNYRAHILEMGRELPEHPTLFAKFSRALIGAHDDVQLPAGSQAMDWEAELTVVVGAELRDAGEAEAARAIAGWTVANDVTARDWQYRSVQWLQGKTLEASTPVGPWLQVSDAASLDARMTCEVDGEIVQDSGTGDLVFGPATLLSRISQVITLVPGDLVLTGTPGGVGHARKPPRYLQDGSVLVTRIEGVGECRNTCRVRPARPVPA